MKENVTLRWNSVPEADGYFIEQWDGERWTFLVTVTSGGSVVIPKVERAVDNQYKINAFAYEGSSKVLLSSGVIKVRKKAPGENVIEKKPKPAEKKRGFVVRYYLSDDGEPCEETTTFIFGIGGRLKPIASLAENIDKDAFLGWKVFREDEQLWFVKDKEGKRQWLHFENNIVPEEYEFVVYPDGQKVVKTAEKGIVRFYAVWK